MKKTISIITSGVFILGIISAFLDIFIDTGKTNIYQISSFLWIMLGLCMAWFINKQAKNDKKASAFRFLFIIAMISLLCSVSIDPVGQYGEIGMTLFKITIGSYVLAVILGIISLIQKKA